MILSLDSSESRGYKFSGNIAYSKDVVPVCCQRIMSFYSRKTGYNFNGILVNHYPDGNYDIGAHSDQMGELDKNAGVITISVGETRDFQILDSKKNVLKTLKLEHGSVVWMAGSEFQKKFKHAVPKDSSKSSERYSLTLRSYNK